MIVVIPSNRAVNLSHLAPLIDSGVRFIVVDDSEGTIQVDHPSFEVYTWADRRRMLGDLDVAIPKRNGACRDFGFLLAWRCSDDDEIIVALDDDCAVRCEDFIAQTHRALSSVPRPMAESDSAHLNIIDLYENVPGGLFPRGFPYSARANSSRVSFGPPQAREVRFSLGLWTDVFDVNGIDKLRGPEWVHPDATLRHESVLIPEGRLVSVCSMNMQFRREVLPAVYQLPMRIEVMPNWVIDRYGDIWGGFILKTLMDKRGDAMAVGEPMVQHLKDGDYQSNIWQEHLCHLVNDEFLAVLAEASESIKDDDYVNMMQALNDEFRTLRLSCSPILSPYLEHLVIAIDAWTSALIS